MIILITNEPAILPPAATACIPVLTNAGANTAVNTSATVFIVSLILLRCSLAVSAVPLKTSNLSLTFCTISFTLSQFLYSSIAAPAIAIIIATTFVPGLNIAPIKPTFLISFDNLAKVIIDVPTPVVILPITNSTGPADTANLSKSFCQSSKGMLSHIVLTTLFMLPAAILNASTMFLASCSTSASGLPNPPRKSCTLALAMPIEPLTVSIASFAVVPVISICSCTLWIASIIL